MECRWGNGDRAFSQQRETREVGGQTKHYTESLVPFHPKSSAELRDNSELLGESLVHRGLVGGEGGIRTLGTGYPVRQISNLVPSTTRPPLRSMKSSIYAVSAFGVTSKTSAKT